LYSIRDAGKVAVLAGGPSSEREISLESGRAVFNALRAKGCDVVWLEISGGGLEAGLRSVAFDTAFIALHGKVGEDGTVQKALERMSRPYTGSGVTASRLAMDKIASRAVFEKNGIPVPDYRTLNSSSAPAPDDFVYPVVVKPSGEGSSIGLSLARDKKEFDAALKKAFEHGDRIIVERFIKGRELTVGILEERPLPVLEIKPRGNFYDFYAKYRDKGTRYEVPARLSRRLYDEAQTLGIRAHKALGCSDFSRVDMLLGEDGALRVLEVNTIPGLTERSLLPKAAGACGMDFGGLCVKLLELALANKSGKK